MSKEAEVFHVKKTPSGLQVWSTRRLPLDGHGWKSELREAIREGLKQISTEPESIFRALLN